MLGGINSWSYHGEGTDVAHDRCVWSNFHVPRVPNPELINMQRWESQQREVQGNQRLSSPEAHQDVSQEADGFGELVGLILHS